MPYLITAHASLAVVGVYYKVLSSAAVGKTSPVMLEVSTQRKLQKQGPGLEQGEILL